MSSMNALRLAHHSLRIKDPHVSLPFSTERLGMTFVAQYAWPETTDVSYFLACTDERPPQSDIDAVANREWLWQRPYTTLESQHRWQADETTTDIRRSELGFEELSFVAQDLPAVKEKCVRNGVPTETPILFDPSFEANIMTVLDPDKIHVRFIEKRKNRAEK